MSATILIATLAHPGWDSHLPSSLNQSVPPGEVIVVIDRETDLAERAEIQEKWPSVNFLFNDHNIGLTKSLNRGLIAATGDYIFRADDDDVYREDRIEKQLACFAATDADLVGSWATGILPDREGRSYLIRCPETDSDIRKALGHRNILIHPSLAFHRKRILALGGYDESFRYAQDYALYLAGIRAGYRFAAVPEPLLKRYYPQSSITIKRRKQQLIFSCAAKIVHHGHANDTAAFLRTLAHYAFLAVIPSRLRRWRRYFSSLTGKGA